jgi:hypothetical protein
VHYKCFTHLTQTSGCDICRKCESQYNAIQYTRKKKSFLKFIIDRQYPFWQFLRNLYCFLSLILIIKSLNKGIRCELRPILNSPHFLNISFKKEWALIKRKFLEQMPSISLVLNLKNWIEYWLELKE